MRKSTNLNKERIISLYEKMQICCMLKEFFDNIPNRGNKLAYEDTDKYTNINKKRALQVYAAYLYVVIDSIHKGNIQIKKLEEFNGILLKKYTIGGKQSTLKNILYFYRNKTFHDTNKSYYNEKNLYEFDLINCIDDVDKLIDIIHFNVKNNLDVLIDKNMMFYQSSFFKEICNRKNKIEEGEINE